MSADTPPAAGTARNTAAFFISSLFAFIGGHVMNYSVVLYSQDVLQSNTLAGLAFFLCFFPPLLLGLYAGVLCDRHSTKTIIGCAQGVFMVSAGCLLAMQLLRLEAAAAAAMILAAGLLNGIAWSFVAPARLASLGRLVHAQRLGHVSVLFNLIVMVGFGAAPVLLGITTQLSGWTASFVLGLLLFVAAQLSLPGVRMWWSPASGRRTVLGEFQAGVVYLRRHPLLLQLLACALVMFLTMGPIQVVWPRFARAVLHLDDAQRGLYLGSLALALLLGGALAGVLRTRVHHGRTILSGALLVGAAVTVMPLLPWRLPALALIVGSGIVAGLVVSLIVASLQVNTDDAMRGRVMSFYTISSQVGPALAGLGAGLVAGGFGVTAGLAAAGLCIAGLGALGWLSMRRLRTFAGR